MDNSAEMIIQQFALLLILIQYIDNLLCSYIIVIMIQGITYQQCLDDVYLFNECSLPAVICCILVILISSC